jgi:hypothetical protein
MKLSELTHYTELIEKKPSKHTSKLQQIIILNHHKGYDYSKKRAYTYLTYKTKEGTYYPAANREFAILDGLVGTINLSDLKREYTIVK